MPWEQIIEGITGQGGAIIVCMVVMIGCYKIMVDHILPAHERTIDKISSGCENRTREMLASHEADRATFHKAFEQVDRRLVTIEKVVDDIKDQLT